VYDTERTMMVQTDDDQEKKVTINKDVMAYGSETYRMNDVTRMKFNGVRVVLGPSYASRRQEAVQLLMQLVQALPQVGMVAGDLIAKNLDFEGAEQLAERLKATLPPQILQLENPEAAQAQQPPPDPMQDAQTQAGLQMMDQELETAQAKTAQEKAKAAQETAKVEGVQLDNALKVKRLTEPPPQRQPGRDVGNQARQ
jgi:D-alanyl-D-alanine carboxypeptidase